MHYNFEAPVSRKIKVQSKDVEVVTPTVKNIKRFLTDDQRMAIKHAGMQYKSGKRAATKSVTPTPHPSTSRLGRYARAYYSAKGHLPYYVDHRPLDEFAGMNGTTPIHWKLYPNPVCAFFCKEVTDGQNSEIIFSNRVANKPEDSYVDDSYSDLSPAVFINQPYDEWTIYDNYQDNFTFFNTRRTDDAGNWDPIHDLVSSFCMSTFGELSWDDIENYYGWVAYQLWLWLTKNITTTQHSLTITVGNAYKLFAALLSMTNPDIGQALVYYHKGSETYQQVILTDEFGLKVSSFQLAISSAIADRKPEYRKTRNSCYQVDMNFDSVIENNGITYGVITRDGIDYCLELDSNGLAKCYVPEELDWSDGEVSGNTIIKTFEFSAPVHLNFVGLVMNSASNTNTVYETVNSLGDVQFAELRELSWSEHHDIHEWLGVSATTSTTGVTIAQSAISNPYKPAGSVGFACSDYQTLYQYQDNWHYNNQDHPHQSVQWHSGTENRLNLGPIGFKNARMYHSASSVTVICSLHFSGMVFTGAPSEIQELRSLRLLMVRKGDIGTAGGSYFDFYAEGMTPDIYRATHSAYVDQDQHLYQLEWRYPNATVRERFKDFCNRVGDCELMLAKMAGVKDKINGVEQNVTMRIFVVSVNNWKVRDYNVEGFVYNAQNVRDTWHPESLTYVGLLSKPYGTWAMHPTGYAQSDTFPHVEVTTRLRDIVTMAVLKRVWASSFTPKQAATILRYCQGANGLQTDSEILRHLVTEATAVRAVRTSSIIAALKDLLSTTDQGAVTVSRAVKTTLGSAHSELQPLATAITSSTFTNLFSSIPNNGSQLQMEFECLSLVDSSLPLGKSAFQPGYGRPMSARQIAENWFLLCGLYSRRAEFGAEFAAQCEATYKKIRKTGFTYMDGPGVFKHLTYDMLPTGQLKKVVGTVDVSVDAVSTAYQHAMDAARVSIDADFARDNPELATAVVYDSDADAYYIKANEWFQTIKAFDLVQEHQDLQELGYTSSTTLSDIINDYLIECDKAAIDVSDGLATHSEAKLSTLQMFLKTVNAAVAEENAQLSAALLNFKLEECYDDIADDEALIQSDDALSNVTAKIDEIKSTLIADVRNAATPVANNASAVLSEASYLTSIISDKFAALAETTAQKARSYYSQLIAQFTDVKDGIQQLTSLLSFSVTNMVEKVRSNVSDVQTFLQQMVGAAPNDVADYGWQSSTLFTPRSSISMALGVAKEGLLGSISAVFGLVGKVVSGAANKIRSAVMTVVQDGVSYRRRGSGYNTLALQATTSRYSHEYLQTLYPSLYNKLFYEGSSGAMLRGDNSRYVASQIGPLFAFMQDFTNDDGEVQTMVTVNPAIIDTDDTLSDNSDYTFAKCMAESIRHSIQFMNGMIDLLASFGKDVGFCKYTVPTVNDLLASIHEKAVGTSSAAAWGWRGLILGLGIAAGAILCCTGYGTAAGIALIAGVTIAAECMTAGTAVDQTKIEHLENDKAYANATILASDLASIWTSSMPASTLRLACYVLDLMANFTPDGQEFYDLVHDGRGTALDLDVILETESGSNPGEIGYLPLIEGVKRPNFRYSLVTDVQRTMISLAGAIALSIPVFILAKKAVIATANKVAAKLAAKKQAEQWALHNPDESDFTSTVDVTDASGNVVGSKTVVDRAAYAAAQKKYKQQQTKLAYKANKLSGICITEANSGESKSVVESVFGVIAPAKTGEDSLAESVQLLINRVG